MPFFINYRILKIEFIWLEDIDLGSQNSRIINFFKQSTYHRNLVILTFIEAGIAGGGGAASVPPSRARNSEPHSRARVNLHNCLRAPAPC